ncbi:MAG: laccase domain-containing protein [Candidatus Vogelbacteria bacterium]|nr:laccase domain-containing protein [Candidatus Vogelbacteria bacterium]
MIKPTLRQSLWNDTLELFYFGLDGFRYWYELRSVLCDSLGYSEVATEALGNLSEICSGLGFGEVLMPSPENKVRLIKATEIPNRIKCSSTANLWRGIKADGLQRIPRGSAFAMLGGDCPIGLMQDSNTKEICAGHICRENMTNGLSSMADAMFSTFGSSCGTLKTFIGCGINPKHFVHRWDDPKFGEMNRELTERIIGLYGRQAIVGSYKKGCIDLKALWFAALKRSSKVSVWDMETDDVDTYGDHSYGSNRRDGISSRNLVLAINRA